jgi:CHAD domain-containing protein
MSFDIERIHDSSRQVTKFLRKNPRQPGSDAIHKLRKSARSLETTFTTLGLQANRKTRRLLRDLKSVRKRAGKLRDMDVLTADALAVKPDSEQDCQVQLLEYLGAQRNKYAKELRQAVDWAGRRFRRQLKRTTKHVEKLLRRADNKPTGAKATQMTMARALMLSSDLSSPVRLNRDNLHPYRLKVKELQNVLRLSDQTRGEEFLDDLGEVKDAIGEWHDREELIAIAARFLDHGECKLIRHLRAASKARYEHALSLTSRLRSRYLQPGKAKHPAHHGKTPALSISVLTATSAVAKH